MPKLAARGRGRKVASGDSSHWLEGKLGVVTAAAEKPKARLSSRPSMVAGGKITGISACALHQGLVVGRDRAHLGREPVGMIPEQSEKRGEKTLREIKGPRSLLPRFRGALGAEAPGGTVEMRLRRPQGGRSAGMGKNA